MENQTITLPSLLRHCELTESDVTIEVDEKDYGDIVGCFTEWKKVAPLCGMETNEIKDIELDYKTEETRRVGFLEAWKEKFAYNATYFCLIQALLKRSKADEARKVCMHLKGKLCGEWVVNVDNF